MAKSIDDLITSQSIEGKSSLDCEMLDGKNASALRRVISDTSFRRRVSVEEQRAQKYNRFSRRRQIAYMVHGHFQSTGAYDAAQGLSDLFNFCLQNDAVRDFDTRWNQIFLRKNWNASGIRPRRFVQKLVARFRTASNSICNVQPRIESRSRDTELSKIEEHVKTTFLSDEKDTQFQSLE